MSTGSGHEPLTLHHDRCFDPDPEVRGIARELHDAIRDLPIISPHGHVDPQILADDVSFSDPAALFVIPDHYITRMLHSQGVSLESLGISPRDGTAMAADPRKVWRCFAEHYHLFLGTPSGYWLDHELHELFGVRTRLSVESSDKVYDQVAERLASPEFRPRALYQRFNIEALATTDGAADSLEHHRAIRESEWTGRVIPTFRPDQLFRIAAPGWPLALAALATAADIRINDVATFLAALKGRRAFFRDHGATATDHGVVEPYTALLTPEELEQLFRHAVAGTATAGDQRRFTAHMLIEMARMSLDDGLVMQLHAGAFRDHDRATFDRFGADRGADIPVATEFTRNLRPLLDVAGNDPRFTLILFTLDEATYSRELAPLAGYYRAIKLGPPWWFHDSMQGMRRFREATTETAGIWNTAGFNDDTRAFCSIPARHDLARRMDANFLAGLVARHLISVADAHRMARALAYDLARESYRL